METAEFGIRLRQLRKQAGLSQRELADKIGVSFTYLSKIESGAMPPPSGKIISQLAKLLSADEDELMILAGKIPPDIARDIVEILKNREAVEFLRAERTQKKIKSAKKKEGVSVMKNLVSYKNLSKAVIPVILVCAVAASLWFASPTAVRALQISITNPASDTLGTAYSFQVAVTIEDSEHLPIERVDLKIYNTDNPTGYYDEYRGLATNDTGYVSYSTFGTGTSASIRANADEHWGYFVAGGYVFWNNQGYTIAGGNQLGYGYQAPGTGPTTITYDVNWTSPSAWPVGSYRIEFTITATDDTPFTQQSSFTLLRAASGAPPSPPSPPEEAPPEAEEVGPGEWDVTEVVTEEGVFTEDVIVESADDVIEIVIEEDTVGLTEEGEPVSEITITEIEDPPPPPEDANIIGLTYDIDAQGATFDQPVTLTLTYDPAEIPEGVSEEDLVVAVWDEDAGEWVELPSVVDPETNTITTEVTHFSKYTIIGRAAPPPPPEEEEIIPAPPEEEEEVVPPPEEEEEVVPPPEEEEEVVPEVVVPEEVPEGIAWWVWLIVGLAGAAVVGVIVWLVLRRRGA